MGRKMGGGPDDVSHSIPGAKATSYNNVPPRRQRRS